MNLRQKSRITTAILTFLFGPLGPVIPPKNEVAAALGLEFSSETGTN